MSRKNLILMIIVLLLFVGVIVTGQTVLQRAIIHPANKEQTSSTSDASYYPSAPKGEKISVGNSSNASSKCSANSSQAVKVSKKLILNYQKYYINYTPTTLPFSSKKADKIVGVVTHAPLTFTVPTFDGKEEVTITTGELKYLPAGGVLYIPTKDRKESALLWYNYGRFYQQYFKGINLQRFLGRLLGYNIYPNWEMNWWGTEWKIDYKIKTPPTATQIATSTMTIREIFPNSWIYYSPKGVEILANGDTLIVLKPTHADNLMRFFVCYYPSQVIFPKFPVSLNGKIPAVKFSGEAMDNPTFYGKEYDKAIAFGKYLICDTVGTFYYKVKNDRIYVSPFFGELLKSADALWKNEENAYLKRWYTYGDPQNDDIPLPTGSK